MMEVKMKDDGGSEKTTHKGKEARGKEEATRGRVYHPYPMSLPKYEDVIADPNLFMETLTNLHLTMGTKCIPPTIGGKVLDLHRLFVEVTSRGGIEKVVADRRWREVTAAFSFPSTATNASYVVRKHYVSFLHHYEQLYFIGSQRSSNPAPQKIGSTPVLSRRRPLAETQTTASKRSRNDGDAPKVLPKVVGEIDGKFELGYFVTVTVGSEKLKGVLYHVPVNSASQVLEDSKITESTNPVSVQHRRRRNRLSKRDHNRPKPNRSGYNFFFAEQHAKFKLIYPGKDREISRIIGDLWNKLTEGEKAVYQERGVQDKERYRSEMAVYKEKLKSSQVISHAVPIQQCPAEAVDMMKEQAVPKVAITVGDLNLTDENSFSSGSGDSVKSSNEDDSEMATFLEAGGNGQPKLLEPLTKVDSLEFERDNAEGKDPSPLVLREGESKTYMELSSNKEELGKDLL